MSLFTINTNHYTKDVQQQALDNLENGKVLFLPELDFALSASEGIIFDPKVVKTNIKNISYNPLTQKIGGLQKDSLHQEVYAACLQRYYEFAKDLLVNLLPQYASDLQIGRTSLRPVEIFGRAAPSYRKDDTRLHVDAFPASPNQGKRILRVFTNINPNDQPRIWNVGEPFADVVAQFIHRLKNPVPGVARLLKFLGITKSLRSNYDHLMLQLHDAMKADQEYQNRVLKSQVAFPARASWIVQTDQVSHAVLRGQYALEQTFYLPVAAMQNPNLSPLAVLQSYRAEKLSA